MAHAKIVSVGPVKDVLSWVEGVYGQFRIAIVGEADLLKAWEAGTAFMVVIEEGIETCNLHANAEVDAAGTIVAFSTIQ